LDVGLESYDMIDAIRNTRGAVARMTGRAFEDWDCVESTAVSGMETRQVVQWVEEEAGTPLRLSRVTCTPFHRTELLPDQTRITRFAGTFSGAAISVGSHETQPDISTADTATRIVRFTSAPRMR
jgi:hypothetical protein